MLLRRRFALLILTAAIALPESTGAIAAPAAGASGTPAAGPSTLPALEDFFENPTFSGAVLSPDARLLAVRTSKPGGRDMLAVVDLGNMSAKIVANFNEADIGSFSWVNNERLVFTSADKQLGQGDIDFAPGLYAVNRDGTQFRQLAERHNAFVRAPTSRELLPWHTYLLRQRGAQDSEHVYVTSPNYQSGQLRDVDLLRLNTLTGRAVPVNRPSNARDFMLDQHGEPRLAIGLDGADEVIWFLDQQTSKWRQVAKFNGYDSKDGFTPVAFGPDGTLYVVTRKKSDKSALFRFDFATGTVETAPIVQVADFDFNGALVTTSDKLLGVRLQTDADSSEWFDPAMKALQARVDAKLPSTINLISVAPRAQTPWILVQSHSDIQPRVTSLFNTETGVLNKVGDSYGKINPARMGQQEFIHFKARDGRSIPAWLTLPRGGGGKNLPMVVLVHGGPYVRGGVWGFHPDAQFLASRGYAVLEPEFRGSTGYGFDHFKAGWKQWGLAMQNDIADATRWAIAKGTADAKRICIAGASYGGYATLMGLVNDPDLYRCGIDWAGVTDIDLLFNGHWSFRSDISDSYKQYGFPVLVGDPKADHERFQATSPLAQAARITQPLLLAYGGADQRVPLYHGKKFYEAVKKTNPNVEYVLYEEEGHGWALPKNRIDFWGRVERFLARNIGQPAVQ